jgi:hypothetical protein
MNNRRQLGKRLGLKSTLKSRLLAASTSVLVGTAVGAVPSPDQVFDRYVAAFKLKIIIPMFRESQNTITKG